MPNLTPDVIAIGFIWYIVFLFSTTCHGERPSWKFQAGIEPCNLVCHIDATDSEDFDKKREGGFKRCSRTLASEAE